MSDLPDSDFSGDSEFDTEDDYSVLGYVPKATDYIRRCHTVDEAIEIIDYLKKRGEISKEEYKKHFDKLKSEGLTAFGVKKNNTSYGEYFLK